MMNTKGRSTTKGVGGALGAEGSAAEREHQSTVRVVGRPQRSLVAGNEAACDLLVGGTGLQAFGPVHECFHIGDFGATGRIGCR